MKMTDTTRQTINATRGFAGIAMIGSAFATWFIVNVGEERWLTLNGRDTGKTWLLMISLGIGTLVSLTVPATRWLMTLGLLTTGWALYRRASDYFEVHNFSVQTDYNITFTTHVAPGYVLLLIALAVALITFVAEFFYQPEPTR